MHISVASGVHKLVCFAQSARCGETDQRYLHVWTDRQSNHSTHLLRMRARGNNARQMLTPLWGRA